jgi:hypothetical protein
MEDNALGMLHRVAGGNVVPPRRSGALTQPLQKLLAADPADRPTMEQVRDELAALAAGRDGDTTTILLARTDLGSAAPGRTRTSSFPADAVVAAATPAPAAAPPAAPSPPPPAPVRADDGPRAPAPPPRQPGRRRGRALWVAAALVALVLAGLIAVWAIDPFADDASNAQGPSADTSAPAEPTPEETQPSASPETETSAESPATNPVDAAAVRAQDVEKAAKEFFKHVPGDLEAAYALTSPSFQGQFSYDSFAGFWDDFQDVKISNIQTTDGSPEATLDIEYVRPDGSRQTERHLITFAPADDGSLLLESDVQSG